MFGAAPPKGVDGVDIVFAVGCASGAAGLGSGGATGTPLAWTLSDAEDPLRGRFDDRWVAGMETPVVGLWLSMVGEEVCCRPYFGRCSRSARCRRATPPGDGIGGI